MTDLVQKARQPKPKKNPDVTVTALKEMPNHEFVGEILATGRTIMPNRWPKLEPEELAFMIVESVEDKTLWRVTLRSTFLIQVVDEWSDEQDRWLNNWIRLRVVCPTEKSKGQRALELFESNPKASKPPDSVIESEVPPSDAAATVQPSPPEATLQPVKAQEHSHGPTWLKDRWNEITTAPLPRVRQLNDVRIRECEKAIKAHGLDDLEKAMQKVEQSDFCRGDGEKRWVASFGWFLTEGNALKALEGNYDNQPYRDHTARSAAAMEKATKIFLENCKRDRSEPDDEK